MDSFNTKKYCSYCYNNASLVGERASEARHYQGCTNSSWCNTCIYIYVWWYVHMYGGTCHILGNSHFLYMSAVSNVATTGNGHLK